MLPLFIEVLRFGTFSVDDDASSSSSISPITFGSSGNSDSCSSLPG